MIEGKLVGIGLVLTRGSGSVTCPPEQQPVLCAGTRSPEVWVQFWVVI